MTINNQMSLYRGKFVDEIMIVLNKIMTVKRHQKAMRKCQNMTSVLYIRN